MEIANRYIRKPESIGQDGLGLSRDEYYYVHDCIIDLSDCPLNAIDEAIGITCGAHGLIENCLIRGAGKLILCGCGDDPNEVPEAAREIGKRVVIKNCVLEDFGRRGPEVQGGMEVVLSQCVIRNWGMSNRFTERAFGAWAHNGGSLIIQHCVFHNSHIWPGLKLWLLDHIGHFGQAWNERGFKAIFSRDAWLSGYRRAATKGPKGRIDCVQCYGTDKRLVIEGNIAPMSKGQAHKMMAQLDLMVGDLVKRLG